MPFLKLPKRKNYVKTISKQFYQDIYQDRRWRLIRAEKLRLNPVCEDCEKIKKVTPAIEVHHVIPFQLGLTREEKEDLAFNIDNTRSLCSKCHDQAHEYLKRQNPAVLLRLYKKYNK